MVPNSVKVFCEIASIIMSFSSMMLARFLSRSAPIEIGPVESLMTVYLYVTPILQLNLGILLGNTGGDKNGTLLHGKDGASLGTLQ